MVKKWVWGPGAGAQARCSMEVSSSSPSLPSSLLPQRGLTSTVAKKKDRVKKGCPERESPEWTWGPRTPSINICVWASTQVPVGPRLRASGAGCPCHWKEFGAEYKYKFENRGRAMRAQAPTLTKTP